MPSERALTTNTIALPGCRRERERRGWTVSELALRAGVNRSTATAADSGQRVSLRTAKAIAEAMRQVPPALDSLLERQQMTQPTEIRKGEFIATLPTPTQPPRPVPPPAETLVLTEDEADSLTNVMNQSDALSADQKARNRKKMLEIASRMA